MKGQNQVESRFTNHDSRVLGLLPVLSLSKGLLPVLSSVEGPVEVGCAAAADAMPSASASKIPRRNRR